MVRDRWHERRRATVVGAPRPADQCLASPIGFANPALYSIATSGPPGNAFNDITAGHNDFTGTNGGRYPATANFDLASGWGSPIGTKLIPFLRG